MQFSSSKSISERPTSDILLIPVFKEKKAPELVANLGAADKAIRFELRSSGFKAEAGEVHFFCSPELKEKRALLVGLGEEKKFSADVARLAFAKVCEMCHRKYFKKLSLIGSKLPHFSESVEALLFRNWEFTKLKGKKGKSAIWEHLHIIGGPQDAKEIACRARDLMEGVFFTRNLITDNANNVTPQHLVKVAKELGKHSKTKTTIFNKKRIEKEGMGLFLAVAEGSSYEPAFIIIEYNGAGKSSDKTVLVGKGVTYDTGGLSLKPSTSMDTMKADMSGSACVLGVMKAAQALKLKVNLTVVIATTDNAIGSRSYRPGDVFKSHLGKTVEVLNTDAEGRLTLADAMSYAIKELKPTRMIDVATLTGACVVALGEYVSALMTRDKTLEKQLMSASEKSGEKLWPMPLVEEYRDLLKSDVADLKNIGSRWGASLQAGLFLEEFTEGLSAWAHLDIAGPAYAEKAYGYFPKHATGYGVRLLIDFLENLS
jgi:leucyl aminopeptidase